MKKKFIVGLTGGIGSGKTTVANVFAKLGVDIVDADIAARDAVAIGSQGLNQIAAHFGQQILLSDGQLNRAALRQAIFDVPEQRLWLNRLLHPLIRHIMLSHIEKSTAAYVILVAPLLFENELDKLVNTTLVVDTSPALQIVRTSERDNVDSGQVAKIIASQMTREQRLEKADNIIENTGNLDHLHQTVALLHQDFLARAQLAPMDELTKQDERTDL